jgi:glycosyltransferase involved in cell wall biosynthesis
MDAVDTDVRDLADGTDPSRTLTLVASDVAPVGGMERAAYELSRRLVARGWRVTVIARSCALEPSPSVRFIRLHSPSRPVSIALLADALLATLALVRYRSGLLHTINPTIINRADIITAQFSEAAFRGAGISRARRPSRLYRLNSWLASWISMLFERWCYRPGRVRRIACVSDGLRRDTERWYPGTRNHLRTIPNGVDFEAFRPNEDVRSHVRRQLRVDDDQLVALFIGGDWHRKGLRHALDALKDAPGWTLVVVGSGDPAAFAQQVDESDVRCRVRFVGRQTDPIPYFVAADALVVPSYFEAFSLVTLEGAAAGLPLIAPAMNGTEELIVDGVNGWFTGRDGHAIAERLRALREDASLRRRMSTAARESAAAYDWDRIADQYEDLYAELLGRS